MKKKVNRRAARLDLRLDPWPAFALRMYAETYQLSLGRAAAEAIKCLISDIPEETMRAWLEKFRKLSFYELV
jgi:hypothetical protein